MNTPTLSDLLARNRYVYTTVDEYAMGAYLGNSVAAERDARRLCRKSNMPVLFYEDGVLTRQFTPVSGRAMETEAGEAA